MPCYNRNNATHDTMPTYTMKIIFLVIILFEEIRTSEELLLLAVPEVRSCS